MNLEQRLSDALHAVDGYEPSPDLYARVRRSVSEDRAHRRRVARVAAVALALVTAVALIVGASLNRSSLSGRLLVPAWVIEVGFAVVAGALILGLGPSLRRFGRSYVFEIFRHSPGNGIHVLRLLDIAYYLVFIGMLLTSLNLDALFDRVVLATRLQDASSRVGSFLLAMGCLHAVTLFMLPLVGLVLSSTKWRVMRSRFGISDPPSPEQATAIRWSVVASVVIGLIQLAGTLLVMTNLIAFAFGP